MMDQRAFKRPRKATRERPVCDICGEKCISTPAWSKHRKTHTPEEIANPVTKPVAHVDTSYMTAIQNILEKRNGGMDMGSVSSVDHDGRVDPD